MALVILALAVVVVVVAVPIMLGKEKIANAFDPFGFNKKLAAQKAGDDLERAILCAEARCFDGCGSLKSNDITWNSGSVSCYKNFCENSKLDKICNDDSRINPVVFQTFETGLGTIIQADDLDDFGCIVQTPSNVCDSGGWTRELVGNKKILYIDREVLVPDTVESVGAGVKPLGFAACSGRLDLAKYGVEVGTFLVPGAAVAKVSFKAAFIALKAGTKTKTLFFAGGGAGALTELFGGQIGIIKSAELKPSTESPIYIWARDYSGIEGFTKGVFYSIAGARFRTGTSDYVAVCGSQTITNCRGDAKPCEGRDKNTCGREIFFGGYDEYGQLAGITRYVQDLGCKWDKDTCTASPAPKSCNQLTEEDVCLLQPGCCWEEQCGSLEARLGGVSKDNPEFKGFSRALDVVGGEGNALIIWGVESLDIKELYELPSIADLKSWSEFGVCKNEGDTILPGTCANKRVNNNQPAYCKVENTKGSFIDYPWECGCPEGYGTEMNKGEVGGKCQQFNANNIRTVELGNTTFVDENGQEIGVRANGADLHIVSALLLDDKGIIVTGIKEDEVTFTTDLGTLDDIGCEPSGNVHYFSCSAQIISDTPGVATVTFQYKGIQETIPVEFLPAQ